MSSSSTNWQDLAVVPGENISKACHGVRSWLMELCDSTVAPEMERGSDASEPRQTPFARDDLQAEVSPSCFEKKHDNVPAQPPEGSTTTEENPNLERQPNKIIFDASHGSFRIIEVYGEVEDAASPNQEKSNSTHHEPSLIHGNSDSYKASSNLTGKFSKTDPKKLSSPAKTVDTKRESVSLPVRNMSANEAQDMEASLLAPSGREMPLVKSWVDGVPDSPVETALEDSTVDPITGEPVITFQYPDTMKNPMDATYPKNNMRSQAIHALLDRHIERYLCSKIPEYGQKKVVQEHQYSYPKADVTLRPAEASDLEDICSLVNRERSNQTGHQEHPVSIPGIKKVFDQCKRQLRPFVVATLPKDVLLDRSKWPADAQAAYEEYVKYKEATSDGNNRTPVVGFAFVEARKSSLLLGDDTSKYTGHITMAVHSDHRRKKIGSALLDRILLSVAPYHRSQLDFGWQCERPSQVYEALSANNARQYATVYLETFQDSEAAKKAPFHKELLERFGFRQVGRLSRTKKEVLGCVTVWHDMLLWELDIQPSSDLR